MRGTVLRAGAGLALALALVGCAKTPPVAPGAAGAPPSIELPAGISVPPGPGPAFTPVQFSQIPGWRDDDQSKAMLAFLASCVQFAALPGQPLGGQGLAATLGGMTNQWRAACAAARLVPPRREKDARAFFERNFQPYLVSGDGSAAGLFTGYYEPEVNGSLHRDAAHQVPLYRRPPDLGKRSPYYTRKEIEHGALAGKHLELLWLSDPIDAFFLQIQAAGRVRLTDGRTIRVSYDGQNGRTYLPIGRLLVDRGAMTLDQVSMQSIRAWLVAHPDQAQALMEENPSYVFFKEIPGLTADVGPPGKLGAPLSPMRSVAVDNSFIPLGAPLFVDTRDSVDGSPIRQVMLAQDVGGAILGPTRGDIFFGWGKDAEERAGRMRQYGTLYILLPKPAPLATR
jgi:membrane-bound lytic murein transglycosylase A